MFDTCEYIRSAISIGRSGVSGLGDIGRCSDYRGTTLPPKCFPKELRNASGSQSKNEERKENTIFW